MQYINRLVERVRSLVFRRQTAYRRVFNSPNGAVVLADLAEFCRAMDSTFNPDARLAANLDGRREVWLRIQNHLHLPPEELYSLLAGQAQTEAAMLNPEGENDV